MYVSRWSSRCSNVVGGLKRVSGDNTCEFTILLVVCASACVFTMPRGTRVSYRAVFFPSETSCLGNACPATVSVIYRRATGGGCFGLCPRCGEGPIHLVFPNRRLEIWHPRYRRRANQASCTSFRLGVGISDVSGHAPCGCSQTYCLGALKNSRRIRTSKTGNRVCPGPCADRTCSAASPSILTSSGVLLRPTSVCSMNLKCFLVLSSLRARGLFRKGTFQELTFWQIAN